MSLSFNPETFDLTFGVLRWLGVMAIVLAVVGVSATLMSLAAVGRTGPVLVLQHIREGFADILGTSPRRVLALTKLTFLEAIRRKTLWVFAVFAVMFLFAGWFMSGVTADPALQVKAYVSFVLRTISWLILPVVLLLACWGLPEDIRARSLHTVVTKPVRRNEVVLGRILGLTLIGVGVLAIMGTFGYFWIVRQLTPDLTPQARELLEARDADKDQLLTKEELGSDLVTFAWLAYPVEIRFDADPADPQGPFVDTNKDGRASLAELTSAARVGALQVFHRLLPARVPIYGNVRFTDRDGNEVEAGINVGDENPFRSFVEGNTKARAIWDFAGINPSRLANGELLLESSFQAFRTHKGDMKRGLPCKFTLIGKASNGTALRVPLEEFYVEEFRRNTYNVKQRNKQLADEANQSIDLEQDLLHDGNLSVEVACLAGGQLLGMARPDLFIRLPDRSFAAGYVKTIVSIGLMMIMVIVLGVVAGTFVKGPVATLLTGFVVVVGRVAHNFMEDLTSGRTQATGFEMHGRGLFDSIFRIPTHSTPTVPLEESFLSRVITTFDNLELTALWAVQQLFPDLGTFDTTEYVANAFDVPWAESLLPSLAVTVGYCLPWILVGYFSLKIRELEAK